MNDKTTVRLHFDNDDTRKAPLVLHIEPWGEDYTLLPGDQCELVVHFDQVEPSFGMVMWDHAMQVYINNSNDWGVYQQGNLLDCGHNRVERSG